MSKKKVKISKQKKIEEKHIEEITDKEEVEFTETTELLDETKLEGRLANRAARGKIKPKRHARGRFKNE